MLALEGIKHVLFSVSEISTIRIVSPPQPKHPGFHEVEQSVCWVILWDGLLKSFIYEHFIYNAFYLTVLEGEKNILCNQDSQIDLYYFDQGSFSYSHFFGGFPMGMCG